MLPDRTSSTRPKPPTPSVSMMLKSVSFRLEKNAFSASYLQVQNTAVPSLDMGKQNFKHFQDILKDEPHFTEHLSSSKDDLSKFFNQMPASCLTSYCTCSIWPRGRTGTSWRFGWRRRWWGRRTREEQGGWWSALSAASLGPKTTLSSPNVN